MTTQRTLDTRTPGTPGTFRFGAVAGLRGAASDWAETARTLEGAGFSTILVPDTLRTASPFLALAAAATATTRLRLGTWVLAAPLRTPAQVVRDTTTLHELAEGRFELGLGAGRPGGEHDAEALAVEWGPPGRRVGLVDATAAAVHETLPDVPIVIAGAGDRMLRIAGAHARTLTLPVPPTATVAEVAEITARASERAGADLEFALQLVGVGDDLPEWIRTRLGLTPELLREADAAAVLSGDVDRDTEHLERLRALTGVSYLTMAYEHADALAPLVGHATGR